MLNQLEFISLNAVTDDVRNMAKKGVRQKRKN